MNIDEAIEILNNTKREIKTWLGYRNENTKKKVIEEETKKWKSIETLINEYNNLKQIEEAHRIENGKLRQEIKDLEETLDNTWSGFKGIQEDLTNQLRNTPPAEYY